MLLAVDIGNSSIKFGVFDGEILHSKFSIPTKRDLTNDDLTRAVRTDHPISSAIICSVVPEVDDQIQEHLKAEFQVEPFVVKYDANFGFAEIMYFDPSALGTDRLVNAFAAAEKYGAPCIVCSFGTATTIDAVSSDHEFLGGLIAPGMQMMADALHHYTSKLPAIDVRSEIWPVITPSTGDCIRAGVFSSQRGLIEVAARDMRKGIGDRSKVIATGGFASIIADKTDIIDVVDENLLLDGLRMLYSRQKS